TPPQSLPLFLNQERRKKEEKKEKNELSLFNRKQALPTFWDTTEKQTLPYNKTVVSYPLATT
ncbi:MAG: hypothetical protein ABFC94_12640, partial [Syntrophomonas sp.]